MKNNRFYLHTIRGQPAGFSEYDKQICHAWLGTPLVKSLQIIRKEQKKCFKNRNLWGFKTNKKDYHYVIVEVPDGK